MAHTITHTHSDTLIITHTHTHTHTLTHTDTHWHTLQRQTTQISHLTPLLGQPTHPHILLLSIIVHRDEIVSDELHHLQLVEKVREELFMLVTMTMRQQDVDVTTRWATSTIWTAYFQHNVCGYVYRLLSDLLKYDQSLKSRFPKNDCAGLSNWWNRWKIKNILRSNE